MGTDSVKITKGEIVTALPKLAILALGFWVTYKYNLWVGLAIQLLAFMQGDFSVEYRFHKTNKKEELP